VAFLVSGLALTAVAAEPRTQTTAAFELYVVQAEERIRQEQTSSESFLAINSLPPAVRSEEEARFRRGEVLVEKRGTSPNANPGRLDPPLVGRGFHPRRNNQPCTFCGAGLRPPGALLPSRGRNLTTDLAQRRRLSHCYAAAQAQGSHRSARHYYDVHYGRLDPAHQFSLSHSTRIAEVADPGQRNEHTLDNGHDHGFMWRLNTYWRFVQLAGGVLVQCEAISLTREIPTGLGWLVGPIINDIPRESLRFTLSATRDAVLEQTTNHPMRTQTTQTRKQ
jgi:hypothetical protein